MDPRAVVFVEVMAAIAAVAVVAFVIFLIAGARRRGGEGAPEGQGSARAARWSQVLLALALLAAVVGLLVWQLSSGALGQAAAGDWRAGDRSLIFFAIMAALGVLALLAFLIFLLVRARGVSRPAAAASDDTAAAEPGVETPSATRLLGLVLLALAFLLLNWIALSPEQQYGLMLRLVYPAALALALVLLFDKATRAWSVKGAAETVREWLLCDGLAFLLILGFLNLAGATAGEAYDAMFWDFLFVALFFVAFWLLDRMVTRYRFLVVYGYLILVPILLSIWRLFQEWAAPEGLSWWGTIWPFFFLAVIFFVLEIIALVATREADRHLVPAIKDAVFVALYGVLLIVAVPGTDA